MLGEMEPSQFDEWMAAEALDGNAVDRVIAVLKLGFATLCRAHGMQLNPDHFDVGREIRFGTEQTSEHTLEQLPGESPQPVASPNQAAALATLTLGPPTNRKG